MVPMLYVVFQRLREGLKRRLGGAAEAQPRSRGFLRASD
jgi:hypothetical protein